MLFVRACWAVINRAGDVKARGETNLGVLDIDQPMALLNSLDGSLAAHATGMLDDPDTCRST